MARERRDNKGRLLLTGEAQIRNGSYTFRYTDENGVRKSITNWKLLPEDPPPKGDTNPECLRDMENRITDRRTKAMPKKTKTVNAFWQEYISMKCEIAETTLVRYIYLYNKHVKNEWGKRPIQSVRYSDVKRFYISRLKHGLSLSTLGNLNNVIPPVFELACREHYIVTNPVDGVYQEFKKRKDWEPKHRDALTEEEQDRLLSYVAHTLDYRELLPVLTVFLGTGIRSGELAGLTWNDIDFKKNTISINHTMNYTATLDGTCKYAPHASAAASPSMSGEYRPCTCSISSRWVCSCSPVMREPLSANSATNCSSRLSFEVLTPVLVSVSVCENACSPSKQVYSIEVRPISAAQTRPSSSASVFIELRTRHAPVPHESSIRPVRPITEAFSRRGADEMGILVSCAA